MKYNSKNIFTLPVIAAAVFVVACSSTDKKTEPPVEPPKVEAPKVETPVVASRSIDPSVKIDELNTRLTKVAVVGLPAFQRTGGKKMDDLAQKSLEESKSVIADMPEGYVLQITGHHNQHPDKSKRTGNGLSVQRAKYVHDYFVKNGVAKEKLAYRGAGSSENDKNLSRDENRRVTFKVVKADSVEAAPAATEEAKEQPKKKARAKAKKPAAKPAAKKEEAKAEVKPAEKPAAPAPAAQPEAK
jgi:hypothetical protein